MTPTLPGRGHDWLDGEARAWDVLSRQRPEDVARRARASYDPAVRRYVLRVFNGTLSVFPKERRIEAHCAITHVLLDDICLYSRLPILWYLIQAQDVPLSGTLVDPGHTNGGLFFGKGAHALPLGELADKYDGDTRAFLRRGAQLGADLLAFGDASLRLFPLPKVPVVLVVWRSDEEFPARAHLLFDSTYAAHLPIDIAWSTAMMTVLLMRLPQNKRHTGHE